MLVFKLESVNILSSLVTNLTLISIFFELKSMTEKQTTQFSPVQEAFIPNIKIIGVGGAGGNVVTQMAEENLDQVETIICNTDVKALKRNKSHKKIELGKKLTRGMGAGARPEVGEGAAEESLAELSEAVEGANMVFIAAGMGGGTGT